MSRRLSPNFGITVEIGTLNIFETCSELRFFDGRISIGRIGELPPELRIQKLSSFFHGLID